MKRMLVGLAVVVVGASLFGLVWITHGTVSKTTATSPSSGNAPVSGAASGNHGVNTLLATSHPPLISANE